MLIHARLVLILELINPPANAHRGTIRTMPAKKKYAKNVSINAQNALILMKPLIVAVNVEFLEQKSQTTVFVP